MKENSNNIHIQIFMFFLLCSLISFGGAMLFLADKGMPARSDQVDIYFSYMLMILLSGPLFSGLILKVCFEGFNGFRDVLRKLTLFNFRFKWYLIALIFTPGIIFLLLGIMSLYSDQYTPAIWNSNQKVELLIQGVMIGILGGFMEELGWTTFLTPKILYKNSIFVAGIMVGFYWGFWHLPMTYWASGDSNGAFSMDLFLPPFIFYFAVLPVYRVLMVWLYSKTESLWLSVFAHASLIFSTLFVLKPEASGWMLSVYYLLLSAIFWILIFVIFKQNYLNHEKKMAVD